MCSSHSSGRPRSKFQEDLWVVLPFQDDSFVVRDAAYEYLNSIVDESALGILCQQIASSEEPAARSMKPGVGKAEPSDAIKFRRRLLAKQSGKMNIFRRES